MEVVLGKERIDEIGIRVVNLLVADDNVFLDWNRVVAVVNPLVIVHYHEVQRTKIVQHLLLCLSALPGLTFLTGLQ